MLTYFHCCLVSDRLQNGFYSMFDNQYRKSSNKPPGLICKNEFLDGGLFEGGGAYIKVWHFPQMVDIKNDIIFSIN